MTSVSLHGYFHVFCSLAAQSCDWLNSASALDINVQHKHVLKVFNAVKGKTYGTVTRRGVVCVGEEQQSAMSRNCIVELNIYFVIYTYIHTDISLYT
jgi:hypothetical protein